AAAILALWVASAVLAASNLAFLPRLRRARPPAAPRVSMIVPARNEERALEAPLCALLAQDYPDFEVVLVNDQSTDRTGEIARAVASTDVRLRVIDGEPPPPGWLGKPWAHHQGAQAATGELLLFVDADVHYETSALAAAVAEIERSGAGLLSVLPRVEMRGFWEHVLMPQLALAAFAFLPTALVNHVRAARLAIGGGTGILIRRAVYDAAGGHVALRDAVIDDISLARIGARIAPLRLVVASDLVGVRMYHGLREIVAGFTKNFYFVIGARLPVAAAIIAVSVVIHVAPWVWGVALLADLQRGASLSAASILGAAALVWIHLTRLLVYVPLRYGVANALFAHLPMVAVWTWIAIRSTWEVGVRRRVGWRGRTYDARIKRFGG
ncbi:MAG: glycosyltransferase, partial [Thermoanaerobaculia bacterium]